MSAPVTRPRHVESRALPNPITRGKGQATTTWFEATALSAKFPVSLAIAHTFLA
jgi:hypothetical protein